MRTSGFLADSINSIKRFFKEQNLYLRGLIPLLGYKSTRVYYSRDERVAGESKYPLKDGCTGVRRHNVLTITPLRMIAAAGVTTCLLSSLAAIYAFIEKIRRKYRCGLDICNDCDFFLGGVQMLSLGIIGEYVGKIYMESKKPAKIFYRRGSKIRNERRAMNTKDEWMTPYTKKVIAMLYLAAIFLVYSPTIIFSYAFSDDWSTLSDIFSGKGLSVSMGYAIRQTLVCRCQMTCLYASSQYR